jgi:hypothetical protein
MHNKWWLFWEYISHNRIGYIYLEYIYRIYIEYKCLNILSYVSVKLS